MRGAKILKAFFRIKDFYTKKDSVSKAGGGRLLRAEARRLKISKWRKIAACNNRVNIQKAKENATRLIAMQLRASAVFASAACKKHSQFFQKLERFYIFFEVAEIVVC